MHSQRRDVYFEEPEHVKIIVHIQNYMVQRTSFDEFVLDDERIGNKRWVGSTYFMSCFYLRIL